MLFNSISRKITCTLKGSEIAGKLDLGAIVAASLVGMLRRVHRAFFRHFLVPVEIKIISLKVKDPQKG